MLAPIRGFEEINTAAAAITTIVAALSPHDAYKQPILRAFHTIGVAVGLAAGWTGPCFAVPWQR